ncbi:MAG TPA: hypothetical protein VLA17_10290 [Candidatus Limnocylindria bacterium]|nr:hypothetical protein [Candidatus Limnocylindria bacterium]
MIWSLLETDATWSADWRDHPSPITIADRDAGAIGIIGGKPTTTIRAFPPGPGSIRATRKYHGV